jgi:hypothetical protein
VRKKMGLSGCDAGPLKAKSENVHALYSAPAFQSQTLTDALRLSRLALTGLSFAHAAAVASLCFGEARQ